MQQSQCFGVTLDGQSSQRMGLDIRAMFFVNVVRVFSVGQSVGYVSYLVLSYSYPYIDK